MKIPHVDQPNRYVGLFAVDFGDHSAVGFTAEEIAELLESERFAEAKVYKIYRAAPDGTMELRGVQREVFEVEAGLFFYADDASTGRADFEGVEKLSEQAPPPCRCKLHLAQLGEHFLTALIYPAEYDDAVSRWLLDGQYRNAGLAEGGTEAVGRYYQQQWEVLDRRQLWPAISADRLQGEALFDAAKRAVVR